MAKISGLLSQFALDPQDQKQLLAGGLAAVFAYAAGFATGFAGFIPDPVQSLVHGFQVTHLPLHGVFSLVTATAGAAGMAAWQRRRERNVPAPE